MKQPAERLPARSQVPQADRWDLSSLYGDDAVWEKAFDKWRKRTDGFAQFKKTLVRSAAKLAECLQYEAECDRQGERLGNYAMLKAAEDQADSAYQRMRGRLQQAAALMAEASSFIRPAILQIPVAKMRLFLRSAELAEFRIQLQRLLRYRPHMLSLEGETMLAMAGPMSEAANQIFRQLNDADLKWPCIEDEQGQAVELGHASYSTFLHSPKRPVRQKAFATYYTQYEAHQNTLAASLAGSVQRDVYLARVRHFPGALQAALFSDDVPVGVYDNLINTVRKHVPVVQRYLELRRRKLKLKQVHQYDTYVPILSKLQKRTSWDQAVQQVLKALEPLGPEYGRVLGAGLTQQRWCDRYPNQSKQSGAFSSGTYDGHPYILMNYQPKVMDHIFTLAHEAGHSMHTYFSARTQRYPDYNYVIFVAEVASTFNEQLLLRHLLNQTSDKHERAFLINHAIDEIRGTIIRQTMFAEFEKIIHQQVEAGEPLTVKSLRGEYRKLLEAYFGPEFVIDEPLELECLRIPHFYRAFYVYKYATGLSAAIALSTRVLEGGKKELADYLNFLRAGGSKFPLELLKDAGVDMSKPAPVDLAMERLEKLVEELEQLI